MATLSLTWKDLNIGEDGFNIYRSETPMDVNNMPAPIATVGPNVGSYDDTTGVVGTWYYYRIGVVRGSEEKFTVNFSRRFGIYTIDTHDIFGDGSAVATYQFDGDITDLGGNFEASSIGTMNFGDGIFGNALTLAYNNNGIQTQPFSATVISLWWKKDIWEGNPFLLELQNGDRIYVRGSTFILDGFFQNTKIDNNVYSSGDSLPLDSEWHHFYTEIPFTDNWVLFGTETGPNNRSFDGSLDQIRIFNRALTTDEIDFVFQEKNQV